MIRSHSSLAASLICRRLLQPPFAFALRARVHARRKVAQWARAPPGISRRLGGSSPAGWWRCLKTSFRASAADRAAAADCAARGALLRVRLLAGGVVVPHPGRDGHLARRKARPCRREPHSTIHPPRPHCPSSRLPFRPSPLYPPYIRTSLNLSLPPSSPSPPLPPSLPPPARTPLGQTDGQTDRWIDRCVGGEGRQDARTRILTHYPLPYPSPPWQDLAMIYVRPPASNPAEGVGGRG